MLGGRHFSCLITYKYHNKKYRIPWSHIRYDDIYISRESAREREREREIYGRGC